MQLTRADRSGVVLSGYLHPRRTADGEPIDAVLVGDRRDYSARVSSWRLGAVAACDILDRNAATVTSILASSAAPGSRYLIGMLREGSGSLSASGRTMPLRPGGIAVYSANSPFQLRFDVPYHYVLAEVPDAAARPVAHLLDAAVANPDLSETATGRMFAELLRHTPGHAERMPITLRHQLGDTLLGLLNASLGDLAGEVQAPSGGMFDAMIGWIEAHLGEPELSPARVAAATHTSVRYVHKLFQVQGTTVGEYIRSRRVERVKHDLLAPEFASWSVADIGARWGVPDATQLGRLFRTIEHTTPGVWRRQQLALSAAAATR